MNRHDFLQTLEKNLAGASPEERVAALQFFTEYLDEAGPEREAEVLAELGSPEKVAADILSVSSAEGTGAGEAKAPAALPAPAQPAGETTPPWLAAVTNVFSSLGQAPGAPDPPKDGIYPPQGGKAASQSPPPQGAETEAAQAASDGDTRPVHTPPGPDNGQAGAASATGYSDQNSRVAKIVLIVLACIFLSPVIGGLFSALVALLAAVVILFLCPIIIGVAFVATAIFSLVMGILLMTTSVPNGLVVLGMAIVLLGLGGLACYGGVKLLGGVLPKLVRLVVNGIGTLWRKIFH